MALHRIDAEVRGRIYVCSRHGRQSEGESWFQSGFQNGTYVANLANAIYYANPTIFGIGQKFELDKDVIKSKVSTFTGEKAGSITYNGATFNTPGGTTTSYYAKKGAPQSSYKFGVGGTDANYASYWGSNIPQKTTTTPSSSSTETKKEEEKKDDKKENTTPSSSKEN